MFALSHLKMINIYIQTLEQHDIYNCSSLHLLLRDLQQLQDSNHTTKTKYKSLNKYKGCFTLSRRKTDNLSCHLLLSIYLLEVSSTEPHLSIIWKFVFSALVRREAVSTALQRKTNSSLFFLLLEYPTVRGGKMWVAGKV